MMRSRLKEAEVLEIGEHREQDLIADGCDLHLGQHQPQVLDSARPAGTAVTHEAGRFVVPFPKWNATHVDAEWWPFRFAQIKNGVGIEAVIGAVIHSWQHAT